MEIRFLGTLPYDEAWRLQGELLEARAAGKIPDTLLVVEHPPVITMGRKSPELASAKEQGITSIGGVPLFLVERGGEATFHGPGQLVVYPIVKLKMPEMGPKSFLRLLEEAIIDCCREFGLPSYWIEGKTGVWLKDNEGRERKIASLGIAVRHSVSYHGLALNLSTDLKYFSLIQPCGFASSVMTNLEHETGKKIDFESAARTLCRRIEERYALL